MRALLVTFAAGLVSACAAHGPAAQGRGQAKMTEPSTAAPAQTQHRTVNGVTFAYETRGEGMPLVVLHGLPGDRRMMIGRYESMFGPHSPWRRIYPDLPGAGETGAQEAIKDTDGYIDAVNAFIEAETGHAKIAVMGISYGAFFAMAYAKRRPENLAGLALIIPGFGPGEELELPARSVLVSEPGFLDDAPPPAKAGFLAAATVQTKDVWAAVQREVAPGIRAANMDYLRRVLVRASDQKEIREHAFAGPALVVTGRQDSICGFKDGYRTAERFPRATYAVLDRAGHSLHMEQTTLLHAHVGEWLWRVEDEGHGRRFVGDHALAK